jgi:hypothetical protein
MVGELATRHDALVAFPTVSAAARMLGVDPSTLSRRDDVERESRGQRDQVLRPREVMRLALAYRKRSLNEVAYELVRLAERRAGHDPRLVKEVEEEIESFVDDLEHPEPDVRRLLELAERHLPPAVAEEVRRAVVTGGTEAAPPLVGRDDS